MKIETSVVRIYDDKLYVVGRFPVPKMSLGDLRHLLEDMADILLLGRHRTLDGANTIVVRCANGCSLEATIGSFGNAQRRAYPLASPDERRRVAAKKLMAGYIWTREWNDIPAPIGGLFAEGMQAVHEQHSRKHDLLTVPRGRQRGSLPPTTERWPFIVEMGKEGGPTRQKRVRLHPFLVSTESREHLREGEIVRAVYLDAGLKRLKVR